MGVMRNSYPLPLLLALLLLALSGCTTTPEKMASSVSPAVALPQPTSEPVTWKHVASQDFETRYPGMGYSRRFESKTGWADVYFYDGGYKAWQDGIDDPHLRTVYDSVVREIQTVSGKETAVKVLKSDTLTIDGVPYRHAVFLLTLKGNALESHLFLTVLGKRIVKYRITLKTRDDPRTLAILESFIARQTSFSRDEKPPEIAVPSKEGWGYAILLDPETKDVTVGALWLGYVGSRLEYRDKNKIPMPDRLGLVLPSLAEEEYSRGTALKILAELKEKDPALSAPYWETLARVQQAGYLAEYLWTFHRQPNWAGVEEPKQLDAFAAWRKKHLVDHKPETRAALELTDKPQSKKE